MSIYGKSDQAILREIGSRLRRKRLEKNITQQEIADIAGLNRITVGQVERGGSFSVLTLIQLLRALNSLEELDAFLPDPGLSPLQLAKMKGKQRRRASGQKRVDSKRGEPTW